MSQELTAAFVAQLVAEAIKAPFEQVIQRLDAIEQRSPRSAKEPSPADWPSPPSDFQDTKDDSSWDGLKKKSVKTQLLTEARRSFLVFVSACFCST
jgi:hypothetical protein